MGFPHWVKLWWLTPFSEPGRTMSVTGTKQITAAFKTGHTYNSCYLDATIAAQHSTHVCNNLGTHAGTKRVLGHKLFGHA